MMCERCQKRPATVHYTQIINGQKTEMHLCEECARETGQLNFEPFTLPFGSFFSIDNLLSGLMDYTADDYMIQSVKCSFCNSTYEDFKKTGRLGCARCYNVFRDRLMPLVRKIHGHNLHKGKVPKRAGGNLRIERQIERLREQLNDAVRREAYEEAARLRDQIKELEKKLGR